MGKVIALLAACVLLAACAPATPPTACELEQLTTMAESNAVDDYSTHFHSLVKDYTKYYEPVCVHGIPYFMETDESYLDKRGGSQILVPLGKPYFAYSSYFWQACMQLEQSKGKAPPPGEVDPQ